MPEASVPAALSRDTVLHALSAACAVVVVGVVGAIVGEIAWRGASSVDWAFLTAAVRDAGRSGGIGPILVSTSWILAICLIVAVPLGLATATFLSEGERTHPRLVAGTRRSLDLLASTPSIVFGLFGNALFARGLGLGFSILSGALTLACMILPIFTHSAETALRQVPPEVRAGGAALGLSDGRRWLHLTLPIALPGILAGLMLSIGRALAETAALIFTSGYVVRLPQSWWDSGRSLSVHIYDLALNVPGGQTRAAASALVLLSLLVAIHAAAQALTRRWASERNDP